MSVMNVTLLAYTAVLLCAVLLRLISLPPGSLQQTRRMPRLQRKIRYDTRCYFNERSKADPEYMTGLYQREAQTLWIVTSSSECYI